MTHAGLFSGIGGFSLAAQWMGWANIFEVELDPFCRQVLHKNFPESQLFEDVCTFDGLPFRGRIDVLSGGFPCQPFSATGKGLGTADPRALWPQFRRIISECQPRFVVGENVRGLLSNGGGLAFEAVCADLEAEGYEVQPFLLPAVGVGAPHKRDRFWFVAHADGRRPSENQYAVCNRPSSQRAALDAGNAGIATNAHGQRGQAQQHTLPRWQSDLTGCPTAAHAYGDGQPQSEGCECEFGRWVEHSNQRPAADALRHGPQAGRCASSANCVGPIRPSQPNSKRPADGCPVNGYSPSARPSIPDFGLTEPPLCRANDGLSTRLVRARQPLASGHYSPRAKQLKAYGNAIVPQVAYQIFQAIATTL